MKTQLSCLWNRVLAADGAAEAVGLGAGLEDVRLVRDTIEQRLAQPGVREHLSPFGEREIRRDHERDGLASLRDHLEQQLGTDVGERDVTKLVDAQQLEAGIASDDAGQLVLLSRVAEEDDRLRLVDVVTLRELCLLFNSSAGHRCFRH